jgi:hypothetical protein
MSKNLATEDYIFPTGKTPAANVSPIIRVELLELIGVELPE